MWLWFSSMYVEPSVLVWKLEQDRAFLDWNYCDITQQQKKIICMSGSSEYDLRLLILILKYFEHAIIVMSMVYMS